MKNSIFALTIAFLLVFCSMSIAQTQSTPPNSNSVLPAKNTLTFTPKVVALEVEDVYDIQVMALQMTPASSRKLVVSVSNKAESYPRLKGILGVLQFNGISHDDIQIIIRNPTNTAADEDVDIYFNDADGTYNMIVNESTAKMASAYLAVAQ